MKIISKFLTADVEIVGARLEGRKIIIEGMVKGFMPMTVETDFGDVVQMIRVASQPIRERLAARLPGRFGAFMASPAPETTTP